MTLGDKFQNVVAVRHVVTVSRPKPNVLQLSCLDGEFYTYHYEDERVCSADADAIARVIHGMDIMTAGGDA